MYRDADMIKPGAVVVCDRAYTTMVLAYGLSKLGMGLIGTIMPSRLYGGKDHLDKKVTKKSKKGSQHMFTWTSEDHNDGKGVSFMLPSWWT